MTASEFISWLRGFTEACNDYHPTPAQWDRIKEVLEKVDRPVQITFNSGTGNTAATNLANHTNITYTTKQQLND